MPIGRYKVAILADIATVKPLRALIILAALCAFAPCDFAAARVVPLPRPRPAEIPPVPSTQEAMPRGAAGALGLPVAAHGRIGDRSLAAGTGWTWRVRRGRRGEA